MEGTIVSVPSLRYSFGYVDFSPQDLKKIQFKDGKVTYTSIEGVSFTAEPDSPLITLDSRKKVNIKNVETIYLDTAATAKPAHVQEIILRGGDRLAVVSIEEKGSRLSIQLAGRQERYQIPEKNIERIVPIEEANVAFEENMDEQPLDDQPEDSFHSRLAANLPTAGWSVTVQEKPLIAEITYPKAAQGISHCLFAPRGDDYAPFSGIQSAR